ncbi:MAG: N-6 DNA methylase [Anaerolineales bacterium]|nr:N-6 DNA methylase [Anaerolineales bacterium]
MYTPDEIVRFMIESADHLTYKHFGKTLGDKGVEILDPATGTGTFITELIEYLPANQLEYKYDHELHCNEVSILPYYIANLNIEYTYKQKTGKFNEFENICFVDTLDNMGFEHTGKQMNFFGLTDENSERIAKQNAKPIMLVIGNPPYNANQANENENNKNREYPEIDARIKDTYIYESTAQKTKVYDMYARFYRWASDRLDKNGIIAFITNSSFLDSKTFDGFRKIVADEFSHIYIVDLGGNIRNNPKLSGTTHNVFGIQTGVAIAFFIKTDKKGKTPAQIFYTRRDEMELATEKLDYLRSTKISEIKFERIHPDKNNNWLNLTDNDWDNLIPLATKEAKLSGSLKEPKSIFNLFSLGVVTSRDEWVYDFDPSNLENKVRFLIDVYNSETKKHFGKTEQTKVAAQLTQEIKWSRAVKQNLAKGIEYSFEKKRIVQCQYRPFVKRYLYFSKQLNEMQYRLPDIFPDGKPNTNTVIWLKLGAAIPFFALSIDSVPDLLPAGGSACYPLYRYIPRPDRSSSAPESGESTARKKTQVGQDDSGDLSGLNPSGLERVENITDWALAQFKRKYEDGRMKDEKKSKKDSSFITHPSSLTKEDIFHYVYAVLHHPAYRAKYEINLKREFPRIPFYEDFHKWAGWGKRLMELHLNYETVEPYPLQTSEVSKTSEVLPTTRLIARKEKGIRSKLIHKPP